MSTENVKEVKKGVETSVDCLSQGSEATGPEVERWGSRTSFIIASIGSAIGLGNFWR
eukprot:Pgem_evm1s16649